MNSNVGISGLFLGLPGDVVKSILIAVAVLQLIVVVLLAVSVKNDAENLRGNLFLVSPWMWFFVILLTGGYVGAFGYWFIHYSAQRYQDGKRS